MRSAPVGTARILTVSGLVVVVLIVVYLLFVGGGGASYKLEFGNAGQLVKGDLVEVGGVQVGEVKNIQLAHNYRALVTIHVDSSLTPLHEGSTAEIRVPSLSSVANRYVMISPGPNNRPSLADGATLPTTATKGVVDLDEVFDALNPKTRKGLAQVFQGFAEQYAGAEAAANSDSEYFGPALNAVAHVFSELSADQPTLIKFLVSASDALTVIGAHSQNLEGVIGNADTTFKAIGDHENELAQGLKELPQTLTEGTKTFTALPSTFHTLKEFIDVSKPTNKPLTNFLAKLRPLLNVATPVVHNLGLAFNRPGPSNDLTDAALALPALAKALTTGSPATVKSLEESVPVTSVFGPYTPDLEGLFRSFGQDLAYYDANGHYARVSPTFESFKLGENNELTPVSPQEGLQGLKSGQLRRCPGSATQPAADGSAPFTDEGKLSCDPSETP